MTANLSSIDLENHQADILDMLEIRAFETALLKLFQLGLVGGTTHTSIGQEYSAHFICSSLTSRDVVISNHRCHGHFIALEPKKTPDLLAEILGHQSGINQGICGSQHIFVPFRFYSNGIQAGQVSFGVGLASGLRDRQRVICIFVGDGTFGEGALYESLNLMAVKSAPVLLVVENNKIAQSTPSFSVQSGSIESKVNAFGLTIFNASNTDPLCEMAKISQQAIDFVREEQKPAVIVWDTERLGPHSKGDDTRSHSAISALREKDYLHQQLTASSALNEWFDERVEHWILQGKTLGKDDRPAIPSSLIKNSTSLSTEAAREQLDFNTNTLAENLQNLLSTLSEGGSTMYGEDIEPPYCGAFKIIPREISPNFANNMAISESAIIGYTSGFSVATNKVQLCEIMFGDFLWLGADQLINHHTKFTLLHGSASPSLVVRAPIGGGRGYGFSHSQNPAGSFLDTPGLIVIEPTRFHVLTTSSVEKITEKNVCVLLEHKGLYQWKKPVRQDMVTLELIHSAEDNQQFVIAHVGDTEPHTAALCTAFNFEVALQAAQETFIAREVSLQIICPLILTLEPTAEFDLLKPSVHRIILGDESSLNSSWIAVRKYYAKSLSLTTKVINFEGLIYPASKHLENQLMPSIERYKDCIIND